MTANQIAYQNHLETVRTNQANESLKKQYNDEYERSNKAKEYETHRANTVQEAETERSHRANESIGYANVGVQYAMLGETQRSNLARELETNRANVAREIETNRANVANEENYLYKVSKDVATNILTTKMNNTAAMERAKAQAEAQSKVAEIQSQAGLANGIIRSIGYLLKGAK